MTTEIEEKNGVFYVYLVQGKTKVQLNVFGFMDGAKELTTAIDKMIKKAIKA
jgi:hypothetical protein